MSTSAPSTQHQNAQTAETDRSRSELSERRWSVVSFERREASQLTYSEALAAMKALDEHGIPGLCIVTDEAASRIKTPG